MPLVCDAYNFIPNEHSKESPLFLMFGRDPVLPLNTLLEPKIRYLGNDINVFSLEAMKNMFHITATNLKLAQERGDSKDQPLSNKLQPGDTVLVQNHVRGPFDPKFIGDYGVISLKGNQQRWNILNMLNISYLQIDILMSCLIIPCLEERQHSGWTLIIYQIYIGS